MQAAAITAALTLGLTGPYRRQGRDAAAGVRLWAQDVAEDGGVRLTLADDRGSRTVAVGAYAAWVGRTDLHLLVGPYGSGLVRAVAPVACGAGRLLWNHGGSADDLARPGVVSVPAPASSYFGGAVDEAAARRVERLLVVPGAGPFARAVAEGAGSRAAGHGLDVQTVGADALDAEELAGAAVLLAGRFEQDVDVVRRLARRPRRPALLGAVAAGVPDFERELGDLAEGVLGPVQWWPAARVPETGPSGTDFAGRYRRQTGREPSYVAAQAAAAGYLAAAAHRLRLAADDLPGWATSTLLGDFALDAAWRQVGHRVTTVSWERGRMVAVGGA